MIIKVSKNEMGNCGGNEFPVIGGISAQSKGPPAEMLTGDSNVR